MRTILITGANRGVGRRLVDAFTRGGAHVIATARKADDVAALGALERVEAHALDVADPGAIQALAGELEGRTIDVVVANAGVFGPRGEEPGQSPGSIDYQAWLDVLRVNLLGAVATLEAFAPHVFASKEKRFAAITSHLGSIAEAGGGLIAYRTSKAALNMAVMAMARSWAERGGAFAVLHPGWVATDMGGARAPLTPEESAAGLKSVIDGLKASDKAQFLDHRGETLPW